MSANICCFLRSLSTKKARFLGLFWMVRVVITDSAANGHITILLKKSNDDVVFLHVHEYAAPGLEADAIGGHRGVDSHREGLFAIVDEDLGAEPVQGEAEL